MKVVELLEIRRRNWQELESFCDRFQNSVAAPPPAASSRFAALYRGACADLALADSYHLPQNTVQYLHRLVGRAHNQLYRSRKFEFAAWGKALFHDVPQQIFNDRCAQFMFVFFWGFFLLSAFLAYSKSIWPDFAEQVMGRGSLVSMEESFGRDISAIRGGEENIAMAGFYINHNAGIGLQCFAWGLLVVPGLYMTMFNAVQLGTAFGHMAQVGEPARGNFFTFVTAHGPFELTAIVLSAGAGLRLGISWIMPGEIARGASLIQTGRKALPVALAAMAMFFQAALIEGFLSPSTAPYWIKAAVAMFSSLLLVFYFVVLGYPRRSRSATR